MANFCSECGAALTGSKRFCPECGLSTASPPPDEQAPTAESLAAPTNQTAPPEIITPGAPDGGTTGDLDTSSAGGERDNEASRTGVRLTYQSESSSKFWEAKVTGTTTVVHFGKLGTAGQTRTHEYPTTSEAEAAVERKIAEKLRKGYLLEGGADGPSPKGQDSPPNDGEEKDPASILEDPGISSGLWYAKPMVESGYFTPQEIIDFSWANDDEFDGDLDHCWLAVEKLWDEAQRQWDASRTSDADRLDTMLKILRARNVIVAENEEDCRTCIGGWAKRAMADRAALGQSPVGWVGFHSQDIEEGVGPELLFYYGAYFPHEVDDAEAAAADTQVAQLLQDAAEAVGLDTEWDGDTAKRFTVFVPDWRKRRDPFNRWTARIGVEYPDDLLDVLDMLGQDVDPRVRAEAAGNPNADAALLHQLASDSSPMVRCRVAANPSTYEALQRWLAESDPDPEVRSVARETFD